MRIFLVALLSLLIFLPGMARKKKAKTFTNLEQITSSEDLNLSLEQTDFSQDLNNGPINLSFLLNASSLIKSGIYPTSFKTEIYAVNDDASKDLLTIYRPTIFSSKKAQNLVFDLPLLNLVKTSELEINLYDTNNSLVAIFKANIEVENPSSTVFSAVADSDCTGVFGECHLEYILQNIHFVGKRAKDIQTTVEKNLDGSYLVNLPLSKSNKAQKIINRINGNSNPGTNSNLNLEFDGTNLFVVAEDGTKTQVAAQGPQGEAGEPGSVGPSGPQGPQGATGVGVTGAAGATGAVQFNAGGALAADSTNFFWDDGNNRLGIGTANPATPLQVNGTLTVDEATPVLRLNDTDGSTSRPRITFQNNTQAYVVGNDSFQQSFVFSSAYSNSRTNDAILRVQGDTVSTGDSWGNYLAISHTGLHGSIFTDLGDIRLLPQTGNVSIGTTNQTQELTVNGNAAFLDSTTNGRIILNTFDGAIEMTSGNDNGSFIDFRGNHQFAEDYRGRISYNSNQSNGNFRFQTSNGVSNTVQMIITENGNIGVGSGMTNPQRSLHIDDVMRLEPRTTAPTSPSLGDVYVDDSNAFCVYLDAAWTKLGGSGSCT